MASAPASQQESGLGSIRSCANEIMQRVSQSMCCSALVIQAHYVLEASLCKRRVCKGRSGNLGTLSKREGLQQVSCGPPYMSTKSAVWKL